MKILKAAQFRSLDQLSGDTLALMENAGTRVVEAIQERFENIEDLTIYVLCGKGNNGGDGLVVARLLEDLGCAPVVFLFAPKVDVSGDAAINLGRLEVAGNSPVVIGSETEWEDFEIDESADIVIDALLGTGVTRPVEGLYRTIIESLPARFPEATVVSVDLPSGVVADSNELIGPCVQADLTVTFGALKLCLVFPPAHKWAGDVVVADIGHSSDLLNAVEHNLNLLTPEAFPGALHRRQEDSHKGDYGKVLVVGGSLGKSGAAAMAGQAALRSGAGLVTVATPASCLYMIAASMPELMTEPLEETSSGTVANASIESLLRGKSVVAIGPGLGTHPETQSFVQIAVREAPIPVVLDADGLNAFAGQVEKLKGDSERPLVITPHPGEMANLLGTDTKFVNCNRVSVAHDFAVSRSVYVVLKGFRTVIALPDGTVFVNPSGNPGMATAGMGDILTGMISGILAQSHLGTFSERLLFAVHLHGLAADLAAEEIGEEPLVATDLLYYVGDAWKQIRE